MATLSSIIANALGNKVKTEDFILSGKHDKKEANPFAKFGFNNMDGELDNFLKGME